MCIILVYNGIKGKNITEGRICCCKTLCEGSRRWLIPWFAFQVFFHEQFRTFGSVGHPKMKMCTWHVVPFYFIPFSLHSVPFDAFSTFDLKKNVLFRAVLFIFLQFLKCSSRYRAILKPYFHLFKNSKVENFWHFSSGNLYTVIFLSHSVKSPMKYDPASTSTSISVGIMGWFAIHQSPMVFNHCPNTENKIYKKIIICMNTQFMAKDASHSIANCECRHFDAMPCRTRQFILRSNK